MSLLAVLFAIALRLAPCHNRLCGNMSPLTASVNESSAGVLVALIASAELANTVEVLVVAVLREPVEPVAHAVSATTKAKNLIKRRKCTRSKFGQLFKRARLILWSAHEFAWQFTRELVVVDSLYAIY